MRSGQPYLGKMACLGTLIVTIMVMLGTVDGQTTGSSLDQCSYTFYVSGQRQCGEQGAAVQKMEDQLGLLQRQVTSQGEQISSLLRQNEQLIQQLQDKSAPQQSSTSKNLSCFTYCLKAQ